MKELEEKIRAIPTHSDIGVFGNLVKAVESHHVFEAVRSDVIDWNIFKIIDMLHYVDC